MLEEIKSILKRSSGVNFFSFNNFQPEEENFWIFLIDKNSQEKIKNNYYQKEDISQKISQVIPDNQFPKYVSRLKEKENQIINPEVVLACLPKWKEPIENQFINRVSIFQIRKAIRLALKSKTRKISVISFLDLKPEAIKIILENIILARYQFNYYQTSSPKIIPEIDFANFNFSSEDYSREVQEAKVTAEAVNLARNLANLPGQKVTPSQLAKVTQDIFDQSPVKVKILSQNELKNLGMNGILSVGIGSQEKPCLIILEYQGNPQNKATDLVLVGKGITFDSGGLDLKPARGMKEMWMDMSGGAAVIGAIKAISQLKIPVNLVGLIPAAENMPSGSSYRPGDIIKTYSGKTIEVINTDAEGRIVLADAITYGEKQYQPKLIADIATLTGAAMIALGQRVIGFFTDQVEKEKFWRAIGEESGDFIWPLPSWPDYQEEIKGTFGDLANVGRTPYGGAITAALFLKEFCPQTPWIHLDIAPTMTSIEGEGLAKGSTGSGTRYLIKLTQKFNSINK